MTKQPDPRDVFVVTLASALMLWEGKDNKKMTVGELADWILGGMKREGYYFVHVRVSDPESK